MYRKRNEKMNDDRKKNVFVRLHFFFSFFVSPVVIFSAPLF